jgi:hypothetical protein
MRRLLSCLTLISILEPVAATKGQQTPARSHKPLTLAQVWNLDATYRDAEHGVTFRYPSVWQAETQFAYIPPALSSTSSTKPIAGFAYEEGGFPRDQVTGPYSATTLEGFGIVYSVIATGSSAECRASAASLSEPPQPHTTVLAGRSFWVFRTFDGAMMQSTSGRLYATFANHLCYLFETDVAASSAGVLEDVRELTSAQSHSIDLHLLNIMKSVRIETR